MVRQTGKRKIEMMQSKYVIIIMIISPKTSIHMDFILAGVPISWSFPFHIIAPQFIAWAEPYP